MDNQAHRFAGRLAALERRVALIDRALPEVLGLVRREALDGLNEMRRDLGMPIVKPRTRAKAGTGRSW
jgi:hypothetical protein